MMGPMAGPMMVGPMMGPMISNFTLLLFFKQLFVLSILFYTFFYYLFKNNEIEMLNCQSEFLFCIPADGYWFKF